MRKICLIILMLLAFSSVGFAGRGNILSDKDFTDIESKVNFLILDAKVVPLDNGITITFESPIALSNIGRTYDSELYYTASYGAIAIHGVAMSIKNNSEQIKVIKWGESSISTGNYSGTPFLDGMKYKDAGNPSSTPDTLITPGQTITKTVYLPLVKFIPGAGWDNSGELLPRNGSVTFTFALKIQNADSTSQYVSLRTPPIGIPQPPQ